MKLHVLASGSKGNAAIIENEQTHEGILIDCGICKRAVFEGAASAGFDMACLRGVFLTHEHTDHTKGLGVVLRALAKEATQPRIFVNEAVCAASRHVQEALDSVGAPFASIDAGDAVSVAGMQVHVFETSHDAAASFGFRIEQACEGGMDAIGYLTDTGVVTPAAHEALGGVRILALESNHDQRMLAEGPYPLALKQRIASDAGHLSNDQAVSELVRLAEEGSATRLESVVAMHVSQNNNAYRLPREALGRIASSIAPGMRAHVAYQERVVSA